MSRASATRSSHAETESLKPKGILIVQEGRPAPPVERLKHEIDLVIVRKPEEYRQALRGAEILFLNDFRSTLLREIGPGNLRWIHTSSIGVDVLLTEEIVHSDIVVTNSRGVCERPIAEWVLGVLIMFAKDLRRTVELQNEHRWEHRETQPILARRVLVVGPGPVGRETVLLLRAAGMDVTVVGRSGRSDDTLGYIHPFADLDLLLGEVDDVVLTVPLTPETRGMFSTERIARMRHGSRLVNVGRGAVVNERALLDALDSGRLGGAALDVFEVEPLPADHAFWDRRDILVSPHASGDLVGWRDRVVDRFEQNLARYRAGEPLRDIVDLSDLGVSQRGTSSGSRGDLA